MSLKDTYCAQETTTARISANSALSDTINLYGLRLFAIVIPSEWTSANISFQMSPDEGTSWSNIKDQNGNEITAVASASDCVLIDPSQFASLQYIKLRSGSNSSPVTQTASRAIQLILRSV